LYQCTLPIVKLFALVTMHTDDNVSSQSFSLPLNSLDVSHEETTRCRGTLNVFISYKKEKSFVSMRRNPTAGMVGLSVSVLRMCSLKVCFKYLGVNFFSFSRSLSY